MILVQDIVSKEACERLGQTLLQRLKMANTIAFCAPVEKAQPKCGSVLLWRGREPSFDLQRPTPLTHGRSDTAFTAFTACRPTISRNWRRAPRRFS